MIDLGTLQGRIQIDGVSEATNGLTGLSGGFSNAIDMVKKFVTALAIGATIKKVVGDADELKSALNTLETKTGSSAKEMEGFEESLKNIYTQNYGEDFEDIANAMASIKQQTGLTGQALEDTTINAIALRDTFDWEVEESIRATDMMVKQFGITSEEAYNLLAQGAQNGLDKNQNLLDSVNEYSVHFKQLGFDTEEMFNMFSNGAEAGVFDIDKLGDAVKEFGIRAQDGSNTTILAFESLGFNADDLQKRFSEGGETANLAFQEVTQALVNCDDKVVQSTAGVNLFGTMYEDLGIKAIEALTDVTGEINTQKDVLTSIKEIKYDDFGSAMEGIGRQLQVGLLMPLGEKLLPYLNNFAEFVDENIPIIQEAFESTFISMKDILQPIVDNFDKLVPILAGVVTGFVAFEIISGISALWTTLTGAITTAQTAITAAGGAQAFLNGVLAANPIGVVVVAIGALVTALVYLYKNNEEVRVAIDGAWEAIKECFNSAIDFITDLITVFVEVCENLWVEYGDNIKTVTQSFMDYVSIIFKTLFDAIRDLLNIFSMAFKGDWEGVWNGIKEFTSNLLENLGNVFQGWLNLLVSIVTNIGPILKDAASGAFGLLWDGVKFIWEQLTTWLENMVNGVVETVSGIGSNLMNVGRDIFQQLWDGLMEKWNEISDWVSDKVSWLVDKLTFWDNGTSQMTESDGSHRTGLDYVPYDGYSAILHKGEMVLTQAESERYRNQEQQVQTITNVFDTSSIENKIDKLIQITNNIPRGLTIQRNMA